MRYNQRVEAEEAYRAVLQKAQEAYIMERYTIPKKPCSDGYWYIKVKDDTRKNGWRTIKDKTQQGIINRVLSYHGQPDTYIIEETTKTGKSRTIPLTECVRSLLDTVLQIQRRTRLSVFIFPADTETGCITNATVPGFYYRLCRKKHIYVSRDLIRGTHAFRRTLETKVRNAAGVDVANAILGHTTRVADDHYYLGADMDDKRKAMEAAYMDDKKRTTEAANG